jgi:hypothetical protein
MSVEFDLIGEVIEASTTEFTAESKELYSPPAFGSFVKIPLSGSSGSPAQMAAPVPMQSSEDNADPFESDGTFRHKAGAFGRQYRDIMDGDRPEQAIRLQPAIYAVVYNASTAPVDSSRRLRAHWKDEEQLRAEQPEVFEWLLVTNYQAIIIGYSSEGIIRQFLPPTPPRIHAHVYPCTLDEIRLITDGKCFLRTLANSQNAPTEEVIAACIREAGIAHDYSRDFLIAAGKELASLMKDDYDRLQAIMRRVSL